MGQNDVPHGYTSLAAAFMAKPGQYVVYVVGVVTDYSEIKTTKKGGTFVTIDLKDASLKETRTSSSGIPFRCFVPDKASLPKIKEVGDILVIHNARIEEFNNKTMLVSISGRSTWLVISNASIPSPEFMGPFVSGQRQLEGAGNNDIRQSLTREAQLYIIELHRQGEQLMEGQTYRPSGPPTFAIDHRPQSSPVSTTATPQSANQPALPLPNQPKLKRPVVDNVDPNHDRRKLHRANESGKFRLIKDLEAQGFVDIVVQVAHIRSRMDYDLFVTDYTENNLLPYFRAPEESAERGRDGDPYGYISTTPESFPGPYGQRILTVELKPPHQAFAERTLKVGDTILLSNVRLKMNTSTYKLEGNMWRDNRYPDKVCIQKIEDHSLQRVQELLHRKQDYLISRGDAAGVGPRTAVQARDESSGQNLPTRPKKKSRNQKRREREAREAEEALQKINEAAVANQHVKCSYPEIPLTSLREIIDIDDKRHMNQLPDGLAYHLPFINANFRARVQVVNFLPQQLVDFAVLDSQEIMPDLSIRQKWKWSCSLLVQDASKPKAGSEDRMVLNIGHKEMQHLLGNDMEDPQDLRRSENILNKLKEKMCIVWGDLEEQKSAGKEIHPSNRPFECCVSEYGVLKKDGQVGKIEDWTRQYMLHGACIL